MCERTNLSVEDKKKTIRIQNKLITILEGQTILKHGQFCPKLTLW